jgi:hypothetical protein
MVAMVVGLEEEAEDTEDPGSRSTPRVSAEAQSSVAWR